MKTLSRYLMSEVIASSTITILVLWLIFFSHQLIRFFNSAAFDALTAEDMWTVMILQLPKLLTILLPASLFLGILLAYSRLHINNEPLIISTLGLSPRYFLAVNLMLALVVMVIVSALSLWVNPGAQRYIDILMSTASRSSLRLIKDQQFYKLPNYDLVIRVDRKTDTHAFTGKGIFALQEHQQTASCVVVARAAEKKIAKDGVNEYLSLIDGTRYCGKPGQSDYEIEQFQCYNLRLPRPEPPSTGDESTKSLAYLRQNYQYSRQAAAELQWRYAQPISAFLLVIAATALGIVTPVRGRYASFFPAIILYTLYVNFLLLSRAWLKKGVLSSQIGLWWVHAVMLICTLLLCWRSHLLSRK